MSTSRNNHRWLDELPTIVHAHNYSIHRVIGMTVANVTDAKPTIAWERLYGKDKRNELTIQNIHEGDLVRSKTSI